MGCKQSTLRREGARQAAGASPMPPVAARQRHQQQGETECVAPAVALPESHVCTNITISPAIHEDDATRVTLPEDVVAPKSTPPTPVAHNDSTENEVVSTVNLPDTKLCDDVSSCRTEMPSSVSTVSGEQPASLTRCRAALGDRSVNINLPEKCSEPANPSLRKVAFDAETMRKTAPKSHPAVDGKTKTKKQKAAQKQQQQHVSAGRRGPVAYGRDKGAKSIMQTDKYLEMAAAFERLLTNADTINAQLDSR